MVKKLEGAGLRGQVAGETSLSTVGQIEGLAYRGHKDETLADKASFEEVAYLLLYNKLPNKNELAEYKALLKSQREHWDKEDKIGFTYSCDLISQSLITLYIRLGKTD